MFQNIQSAYCHDIGHKETQINIESNQYAQYEAKTHSSGEQWGQKNESPRLTTLTFVQYIKCVQRLHPSHETHFVNITDSLYLTASGVNFPQTQHFSSSSSDDTPDKLSFKT